MGTRNRSGSWWVAPGGLNSALKKQRLTAIWAAQVCFWSCNRWFWCSFFLLQVLNALLLELLAQSSQSLRQPPRWCVTQVHLIGFAAPRLRYLSGMRFSTYNALMVTDASWPMKPVLGGTWRILSSAQGLSVGFQPREMLCRPAIQRGSSQHQELCQTRLIFFLSQFHLFSLFL